MFFLFHRTRCSNANDFNWSRVVIILYLPVKQFVFDATPVGFFPCIGWPRLPRRTETAVVG